MNTVPSTVTLSDAVTIRPWILLTGFLDLSPAGVAFYSGSFAAHAATEPPATASYTYGTAGGGNIGSKISAVGGKYTSGPILFSWQHLLTFLSA